MSRNELTVLPESFGNLTNLTGLYLYGNKLTTLPESIENLITEVHFENNKFKSNTYIQVDNNLIGDLNFILLDKLCKTNPNITKLGLSSQNLKRLPESIENLTLLTFLDLRGMN